MARFLKTLHSTQIEISLLAGQHAWSAYQKITIQDADMPHVIGGIVVAREMPLDTMGSYVNSLLNTGFSEVCDE